MSKCNTLDNEYFYVTHKFYSFDDLNKHLAVHSR